MDYRTDLKISAEQYIASHINQIEARLMKQGYFFYDEFGAIHNAVARYIPEIINVRLELVEEKRVQGVEVMVDSEGCCGIICNAEVFEDYGNDINELIINHYKEMKLSD